MIEHDPNGYDWAEYGYESYEQYIESKAGASPDNDWPFPAEPPFEADDENRKEPA